MVSQDLDDMEQAMEDTIEPQDQLLEELIHQAYLIFVEENNCNHARNEADNLFNIIVHNLFIICTDDDPDYDIVRYKMKTIVNYLLKAPMPKRPKDLE